MKQVFFYLSFRDLRENFDGTDWGNNGPGVLTRVLKEICETSVVKNMNKSKCYGFSVLPIEDCYSIPWVEHQKFFKEQYLNEAMARLNDSLIAHVWNKHSETTPLLSTSNVAYIQLAKEFCPNVLESVAKSGDFF